MTEEWRNDPRFRVDKDNNKIEITPRQRAKKIWDKLEDKDKNKYYTFEQFFKSEDWENKSKFKFRKIKKNSKSPAKTKKIKTKSKIKKIKKNKIKGNSFIKMYGFEYDKKLYVENFLPEVEKILKSQMVGQMSNYPLKLLKTNKGKYWDSDPVNPKTKNEFIFKFFEKKEPKGIEGIWFWDNWGTIGIVREKSVYQIYYIDVIAKNPWKVQIQKSFVDEFLDGWHGRNSNGEEIDYHLCNGTKGGAFLSTRNKNNLKLNCKGVYIVPSEDGSYTFVHEEQTQSAKILNNKLILTRPNFGNEEHKLTRLWPEFTEDADLHGERQNSGSSGTGFFVDNNGHIITNYHVVAPCNNRQKIFFNNKEFNAKLIAKDKQLDLALLKINCKNKDFIKITDKPIKKLQSIIAAGYPGGKSLSDDLKFTSGIISSLKGIEDNSSQIQIDAALNFGNSGGPIVDSKSGELAAVAVGMLRSETVEGINFGIKSSQVKDFLYANKIDTSKLSKKHKKKQLNVILENSTLYVFCKN